MSENDIVQEKAMVRVGSEEFVKIPTSFVNNTSLSGNAIALGTLLAAHAGARGTYLGSVHRVGAQIGGRTSVGKALAELEAGHYVTRLPGFTWGWSVHLDGRSSPAGS